MLSLGMPARLIAASIARAPKSVAPTEIKVPLKFPRGVRTALTITASLIGKTPLALIYGAALLVKAVSRCHCCEVNQNGRITCPIPLTVHGTYAVMAKYRKALTESQG
jgi:hypothetical protein